MTTITFDAASFRTEFTAFSNAVSFPDATLQGYFNAASCYISTTDYGCLSGDCRVRALHLMTAHLCQIAELVSKGQAPNLVTSSSVGSVSVGLTPPPVGSNQWAWWLNTTPYGAELHALLNTASIGGFYIGGRPERSAFRKVGGRF